MTRVLLLGLVGACSQGPLGGNGGNGGGKEPAGEPAIELVSPSDGAGTYSGTMDLTWAVEGFELDPAGIGGAPVDGRGHVHVYVDGAMVEESAADGTSVEGLTSGEHTLRVVLAENDHTELGVEDSTGVQARQASVRLVSPADGSVMTSSSTPLAFTVEDFELVPDEGEHVFGSGHFRILVDGELRDWGSDPLTAVATGLAEGARTIRVELVGGDGLSLDPPVFDEVEVEVPVGTRGVYWDRSAFGTAYDSATLPIALTTTAFTLWDRDLARPPVDGEGHLHIFMDGVWLDATAETSRVLQNVAPGPHLFEARLVTNDGFELPIVDRMWVNVASDRPDALITYPGAEWTMDAAFNLTYSAENFTLDGAAMDGPNEPDAGHAQVFLDGVLAHETADTTVPFTGLLPGTHMVRVQLVNHDRTPLSPAVYNEFPIVVQ